MILKFILDCLNLCFELIENINFYFPIDLFDFSLICKELLCIKVYHISNKIYSCAIFFVNYHSDIQEFFDKLIFSLSFQLHLFVLLHLHIFISIHFLLCYFQIMITFSFLKNYFVEFLFQYFHFNLQLRFSLNH